ncbi:hypothetical protein MMB232_01576 [Brevundimonas subvibrioides]|uniref:hypothetical protein n=1 Tax=Brevundimonas subvibrioides TaxID=74313 RepID=UPI0032D575C9
MSQYDPDPNRIPPERIVVSEPVYTETVVVRRESSTGWWIAGGLAAVVLIAVFWILANRDTTDETQAQLAQAQADAAAAQAQADQAVLQNQINGAQQSVDMARMDAARAQAEAIRATNEARAEQARAASQPPVIIERRVEVPVSTPAPSSPDVATVTPTSPQP